MHSAWIGGIGRADEFRLPRTAAVFAALPLPLPLPSDAALPTLLWRLTPF